MPRTLISVKSCERDCLRGDHEIIRRTWGSGIKDLKFFIGRGCKMFDIDLRGDEVHLNAPDDYDGLPFKTREILRRFLNLDYEFVFLCDTDSYIIPKKLFSCGYENYDIAGRFGNMPALGQQFNYRDARGVYPNCHPWPSGGLGYFVSKKAAKVIVDIEPIVWAEDLHVGQCLGPFIQSGEIKAIDIPNFECSISWHFPRRDYSNKSYDPSYGWMEKMYQEHKND